MSQALYRKYRPQSFDEVYGQTNIVNILKNQIDNNRISHAYLFSGTRGTGKTSCAKIFARAVNCLNPKDGNPCNECANCKAILNESTVDVVEMDAASNRRIDDIRQLRDTVIYAPTDLKYKVYIIDEAHMITNEGFNALLKIMEEPPKHLIFILATTEVDKIPDTILSRTQRFEFKKIDEDVIENRIRDILQKEDVNMDEEAINTISNIGKGSMRDALSVLDQVISIDSENFDVTKVNEILGIVDEKTKLEILNLVLEGDLRGLIELVDRQLDAGKDAYNFIKEIISYMEVLLDIKIGSEKKGTEISPEARELAGKFDLERIISSLDILVEYEQKVKKSDNRNLLVKMSMIRLVDHTPIDSLTGKVKALEDRISILESEDRKNYSNTSSSLNQTRSENNPVSISGDELLQAYARDFEDAQDTNDSQHELSEFDNKDEIEGAKDGNSDIADKAIKETEVSSKQKETETLNKAKVSGDICEKLEKAVRKNALNKFPSSKKLFEEVVEFKYNNETLTYYVTEMGLTYSKVMSNLFAKIGEAFEKQTKQKLDIKFKIAKSDTPKVEINEEKDSIDKIKEFFGDENIEIIE